MVYKYKKFKGRGADYFKNVEKIHSDKKVIDYHKVDYEATQADIDAMNGFKPKKWITIETFEQLIDLFEKCTWEDEEPKSQAYCLEFINIHNISIRMPPNEIINQTYKYWVKKREVEKKPLLRVFWKKPDSSD